MRSVRHPTASAISATGIEARNTQRQLVWSTIQPPVNGPSTDASPNVAPVSPCQRPRSDGGTRSPITITASGISAPAPRPWIARATISWVIESAIAPTTPPATNTRIPSTKKGRRP